MIEISESEVARIEAMLAGIPGGAESALKTAISKGQSTAQQETATGVMETYQISKSNLRTAQNVKIKTTVGAGMVVGQVLYSGTKLPLYRYDISHKYASNGNNRKLLAAKKLNYKTRADFQHAFIAQLKNGHLGIFARKEDGTRNITEIMGDSYPQMVASPVVMDNVETKTMETIHSEIGNAITKELNKYGG